MNRCPHYCKFTSDINIDEEEPVTDSIHDDNEEHLSLEDGDQLFTFDVDGYLENNRTIFDFRFCGSYLIRNQWFVILEISVDVKGK